MAVTVDSSSSLPAAVAASFGLSALPRPAQLPSAPLLLLAHCLSVLSSSLLYYYLPHPPSHHQCQHQMHLCALKCSSVLLPQHGHTSPAVLVGFRSACAGDILCIFQVRLQILSHLQTGTAITFFEAGIHAFCHSVDAYSQEIYKAQLV